MMRIGVSGHRLITDETTRLVGAAVEARLDAFGPFDATGLVVVSSLAIGADQIVARAVLARGGSLVYVPQCSDPRTTYADNELEEFERLRALAVGVVPSPHATANDEAFLDAGLAVLDRSDLILLVWDQLDAVALGGTGDIAAEARRRGTPYDVIWPPGSTRC